MRAIPFSRYVPYTLVSLPICTFRILSPIFDQPIHSFYCLLILQSNVKLRKLTQRFIAWKVLLIMQLLLRYIFLIAIICGTMLYLFPKQRGVQSGLRDSLQTDPIYSTHVFEMELHKDTLPLTFILTWDPNWYQWFLPNMNMWYPTCGGFIVYDTWPNQYPWMGNNGLGINFPVDSAQLKSIDSIAAEIITNETVIALSPQNLSDTSETDTRWQRLIKRLRKFRIFS